MEYQRLKPISGVSAKEATAFTMKTIKELIAEEEAERAAHAAKAEQAANAAKARAHALKQHSVATDCAKDEAPTDRAVCAEPTSVNNPFLSPCESPKSPVKKTAKSLFGRLFGE
ncbi:MAG: hypothetical protein ACSHXH_15080 [Marivita sp.]|uniref:hypothetical protein n=1 Tax=Marivita sp. TaxID=2003365 RepID=UPI003EF95B29